MPAAWTPDQPDRRAPDRRTPSVESLTAKLATLQATLEEIRTEGEADRSALRQDLAVGTTGISRFDRALGIVAMLVVAICVGAVVFAVGFSGRVDLARAQRGECRSAIADRVSTIHVRTVQAAAADAISDDVFQSEKTRAARRDEAQALRASTRELIRRVDPARGGALNCGRAFPSPTGF